MTHPLQFEVSSALDYFRLLVAEDDGFALLEAAVAIGQCADPGLDTQAVLGEVDALAERLRRRLPQDASEMQRLRLLNQFFFKELGFGGNVNDFYAPDNSYVHRVLATRRGIPITLALVYIELASQAGLSASGVGFPGHFLVKLRLTAGEVILDPFDGKSLSREALDERLMPFRNRADLVGDADTPLGLFLQSAQPRDIIARVLRNLKDVHRQSADWAQLLAVLDRLICLLPEAWTEWRDRGLLHAELGRPELAVADLSMYLSHQPDAVDAHRLLRQMGEWRDAPRPWLH
jgi:regulator of sirC expression with transglutaminase-like and TPR domain